MVASSALALLVLTLPSLCSASYYDLRQLLKPSLHRRASRNVPPEGFYDPRATNGSWLTAVEGTWPEGLGEPINAVLSGSSDEAVLKDVETNGGFRNYILSIGFSGECLGQHAGNSQQANLGDGDGYLNETAVLRWNYGDPQLGTCTESIIGGNHFRYWVQDGEKANSGAIFMAFSYEMPIKFQHDIVVNGYNVARDLFVGNATGHQYIATANLTNTSTFTGQSSYAGYTYQSNINYTSGYLQNSSDGINHYASVGVNGVNAIDGLVAVIEVSIVNRPANVKNAASVHAPLPIWPWAPLLTTASLFLLSLLGST